VNERIPGMTERTTSLLIASGGIGSALLPRATGRLMDRLGADVTLWLIASAAAMLIVLLGFMALSDRMNSGRLPIGRTAESGRHLSGPGA